MMFCFEFKLITHSLVTNQNKKKNNFTFDIECETYTLSEKSSIKNSYHYDNMNDI